MGVVSTILRNRKAKAERSEILDRKALNHADQVMLVVNCLRP